MYILVYPCVQAAAAKSRTIDPLAPVDHSLLEYDDFAKDFYTEHPSIAAMSEQQVGQQQQVMLVEAQSYTVKAQLRTFKQC